MCAFLQLLQMFYRQQEEIRRLRELLIQRDVQIKQLELELRNLCTDTGNYWGCWPATLCTPGHRGRLQFLQITPPRFFTGGKINISGSMDFPGLWWSHFPNRHQTVFDGFAVLLQAPLACLLTNVRSLCVNPSERLWKILLFWSWRSHVLSSRNCLFCCPSTWQENGRLKAAASFCSHPGARQCGSCGRCPLARGSPLCWASEAPLAPKWSLHTPLRPQLGPAPRWIGKAVAALTWCWG